jgi:SSS family solute:Na+ symporter
MVHELPAGLPGLMLAGLLAATMSTLSSDLNSLSAVVCDDYYRKLRPRAAEHHHLLFSRLTVLVAGLLGVGLAMAMTRIHSMADAAFDFVSLVGGGVLGMYLLGLTVPRCGAAALHIGIACGIAFAAWSHFCAPGRTALAFLPRFPLHALWVGLISNVVVFTVGCAASRFIRGPHGAPEGAGSHDRHHANLS